MPAEPASPNRLSPANSPSPVDVPVPVPALFSLSLSLRSDIPDWLTPC